jgi:hypothetical protein
MIRMVLVFIHTAYLIVRALLQMATGGLMLAGAW